MIYVHLSYLYIKLANRIVIGFHHIKKLHIIADNGRAVSIYYMGWLRKDILQSMKLPLYFFLQR